MAVNFDVKNIVKLDETTVNGLSNTEINNRLNDAATKSHILWEEYDSTDGKLSEDEAKAIRLLNDNMTVLRVRQEKINEDMEMRKVANNEYKRQNEPIRKPGMFGDTQNANESSNYKTVGELFTESAAFNDFNKSERRSPTVEIDVPESEMRTKTLLTETGFAPQAVRMDLIVPGATRKISVTDLIPSGTTTQNAIVYMEETTTTNAAAFVAEGDAKPESALAFTERSVTVRKLATVLPVTEELFEDVPTMRDYLNARLGIFMDLARESALVNGNGTAPNIRGMLNIVGIQTEAKGANPTPDAVFRAIVKVQTGAFLQPNGVIFHPNDWQDVRLLRTADGMYIWGSPAEAGPERIWGLPVVSTVAATENTAIVAAFDAAMQIFRKSGVSFAVSDQHSDFFVTNKLMVRVEERLAFVVYRPAAICTVTGI